MTREEEIRQEIDFQLAGSFGNYSEGYEEGFIAGAKWADETMIEKACKWLKFNTNWDDEWDEMGKNIDYGMIEEFRKAMEE